MEPKEYQQRVRDEYEELLVKLNKLNGFIQNTLFFTTSDVEQQLLLEQQEAMNAYANTLRKRICLFNS